MPLFGEAASPYDEAVEKVTAETMTGENWAIMMDISDRVASQGQKGAKQALLSVKKRLNHRDPHVVLLALSLLDCLWNNSGTVFRREVSSHDFIHELNYRATSGVRLIAEKTRELIKKWVDNDCCRDPSLSLIESLYKDLREEGYEFPTATPPKPKAMFSNDPNVVSSEQEEADIAKAIALSLSEQGKMDQHKSSSYSSSVFKPAPVKETTIRQVKAVYDFEAVEDNELSFHVGDLINVFDASDANWWRGELVRDGKAGLFPSSFVTMDLSEEPVQSAIQQQGGPVEKQAQIDEEVLKKCIDLLEQCDPTGVVPDDPELAYYEQMSMAQIPLVDQKLTQIDKQHNLLAQVDIAIRDVLAQYDSAVQAPYPAAPPQQYVPVVEPTAMPPNAPTHADPNFHP